LPTTITKTIGSGGNYATVAAWYADNTAFCPSGTNMVTSDTVAVGNIISNISGAAQLANLSGTYTTDATHTITLQGSPGGFRDNANVRTNALVYSSANGWALTSSVASSYALLISQPNTILSGLQIQATGASTYTLGLNNSNITVQNCIITSNAYRQLFQGAGTNKFTNCLFQSAYGGFDINLEFSGGTANMYFCSIVIPSDVNNVSGEVAIDINGGSLTLENCAIFGFSVPWQVSAGSNPTFTTCATDKTGTTGLTGGLTLTNQFVGTTAATADWRQKAGSGLRGTGTADATNGAQDISGLARPQGGNWDIGAWELASAAAKKCSIGFGIGCGIVLGGARLLARNPLMTRRSLLIPKGAGR